MNESLLSGALSRVSQNDNIMEQGWTRKGEQHDRAVGVVNETQLHAKGSSLGHCPTKVTSGLDMVIPHSSTDTFAKPASQPRTKPSLSSSLPLPYARNRLSRVA